MKVIRRGPAWAALAVISLTLSCDTSEQRLLGQFPNHTSSVLGTSSGARWSPRGPRFVAAGASLGFALPREPGQAAEVQTGGDFHLSVEEDEAAGFGSPLSVGTAALIYQKPGGRSFWTQTAMGVEEWLLVDHHPGGIVARWHVRGGTLRQRGAAVDIVDASQMPRIIVEAPEAFEEQDRPVPVTLTARGEWIELSAGSTHGQLLVDPVWRSVAPLATARLRHAAVLLPSGKVLVAGGTTDGTTSLTDSVLYDPATNSWAATGAMAVARHNFSALLLPSGKVLAVGGDTGSGGTAQCELYDPVAGTWSPTGSLVSARYEASVVVLPNGKVLVAGGYYNGTALSSAELYDPSTGTWSATGAMSSAHGEGYLASLPNGLVLMAGGLDASNFINSAAELYDPATGKWTSTGSLPAANYLGSMGVLRTGKVWLAGGYNGGDIAVTYLYDPSSGTWSTSGSMTAGRDLYGAALLPDGRMLAAGGQKPANTDVGTSELYDPSLATWSAGPSVSAAREMPSVTLLASGRVLMVGGSNAGTAQAAVDVLEPATGTWTSTGSMAGARSEHTQTLLNTGSVLVAGGRTTTAQSTAELFNPSSGTWSATGSLAAARFNHAVTLLPNGSALATGGQDASGPLASAELFDPSAGTWSAQPGMVAPRALHTSTLLGNGRVLLAGGTQAAGATAQAELYTPLTATFAATGPLGTARSNHTATLLTSGKVLAAGGVGASSTVLANAELYDPATGTWASTGALVAARQDHVAVLLPSGKVLLAGGHGSGGTSLSSAELFDPGTGTSAATGSMASARERAFGVLLQDGTVLVGGGFNGATPLATTEIFDPALGTWQAGPTLAAARGFTLATLLPNGQALVSGGKNAANALASAELHDEGRGAQPAWKPSLTGPLASVQVGTSRALAGTGFRGTGEGSTGWWTGSPTNYPLAVLRRQDNGATTFLNVSGWSDTALSAAFPSSLQPGPHWLHVVTTGIAGPALPIFVGAAVGPASKLAFGVQPGNLTAGSSFSPALTVAVQDASGQTVTTSSASITLSIANNPGGSTLSGTVTAAAVNGVATFPGLSLNKVGTGYTLQAASTGLTSSTSSSFNVTAGPPTQLVYSMQPTNLAAGSSIAPAVQVSVEDAQGNVVTTSTASVTVALLANPGTSILSGTTTVTAVNGVATFSNLSLNKAGTGYTLQATSTGLTSITSLAFNVTPGTATQLVYATQPSNTVAGSNVAPAVQVSVEDAQGNVVTTSTASVTVALLANPGGSTLSGTTTVAAVSGVATFSNLSLNKAGAGYTLQATSTGLTAATSLSFNVTAGAATQLVYSVQPTNVVAGSSISPSVQVSVEDALGNVVTSSTASITVALLANPGASTLSGTATVAAVSGVASFSNLSLNKAGTGYTLQATSTGLTSATSLAFNVTAGAATQLVYSMQPTNVAAGTSIAPAVQVSVEDAQGNVVTSSSASVTVALLANPGASTLSGTTTVAAVSGVASFSNLSLNKVGTGYTLQATSTGLTSATSLAFNVTAGAATQLVYSMQPTNVAAGSSIAPAVQVSVEDAQGNVVTSSTASITVALLANPGTSTLSGTTTVAAVNGVATFSNLSLNKVGSGYTMQAASSGLTSVTSLGFNVTVGAASQLVYTTPPSNTVAGSNIAPAVQVSVEDAQGNVVTSSTASITVALLANPGSSTLSGTTTVAAVNGVATFSNLSLNKVGAGYTLQVTSTGLTSATSAAFNITVGAASQVAFSVQPSNAVAGSSISPAVQVSVEDAQGNVVTSSTASITVALLANPGSSTLSGTTTVAAVNGVASFGNLSLNKVGTGYTLQASGAGVSSGTSAAFNISAGAATQLVYTAQPSNTAAGSSITPAVQVSVKDALGNVVTSSTASITVALLANPGSSTLSGTTTVAAVSGVATFNNLSLNKVATGYTLQATGTSLSSATSTAFNITPGTATQLAYSMQPTNVAAGSSITPAVQVSVEDAQGNVVTSSTASITLALLSNPGSSTLSGTSTVAAINGVASFSNLSLNKAGTGYTLQATSTGLTSVTSLGFNVTAGPATQLVYSMQPTNVAAGSSMTPAVQVSVEDAQGNVVTSSTASITVALLANPGASTLSGTATVAAVSGVATFGNLSLNKVGTGYTFQATSTGLTSVTSLGFNVTAGAASQLVYTTQPSNTVAGSNIAPAVQVSVQDAQGNVVSSSTASITVALLANPGSSTLSGTTTVAAVSGVATFNNLSLNKAATGYTLQATSSGLAAGTSLGFNITAGAASQLVYTTQPSNVAAGVSISPAVQVSVEDALGNVVPSSTASITVALLANPGSSTLSGTATAAAAGGVATFGNLSLNKFGTGYTLQASATGLASATSAAFNVASGPATQLVYSMQPTNVAAGSSITPAVQVSVEDAQGNVVTSSTASITVALLANPGTSTLSGTTTVAAVNGMATFSNLSLNKAGTGYTLQATSTGLSSATSLAFNVTAGTATKLVVSTQPTSTGAGASISPAVQVSVEDAQGNVVTSSTASITVALLANPGASTLSGTTTVAAVNGVATFSNLSLNKAGTGYTLQATSTGLTSVTSLGFNVTAGTATQLVYTAQPSNTAAGSSISPAVQVAVEDAQGNVVTSSTASITVALLANPGSSTLSGTTTVAAVNGVASFSNLSLNRAGTGYTLQATSAGLASATSAAFNITPGAATQLVYSMQPTNVAAGSSITPAVQVSVEDAQGNVVTSSTASITVALLANPGTSTLSGTTTVAAVSGVATFSNLSLNKAGTGYTLQATSTGLTPVTSLGFNVAAGAATQLVYSMQPTNVAAGSSIAPAVQVAVEDAQGNVVTSSTASITVALLSNPGASTLSGSTTAAAVNGVATFGNLSLNKVGSGYTLQAASTGLATVTSLGFNVTAGAAAQLIYTTQPSNIVAGSNIAPGVQVSVEDAQGNLITSSTASITVALLANPGTSTLSGTTTVSAVSGVATFSNLSLNKAGTGYTLQATSTGLTSVTSLGFNVTAGAGTQLVYTTQPSNIVAGNNIAPAVQVSVEDALGNVVTSSSASITVALLANPGSSTLSGTATVAAVAGVATFGNLSLNKAGTGYTLQATSTGLASTTSVAFNVTAGAATQLVYTTQPSNTVAGGSIAPAVQVAVEDAQGNVVTSSTASISVALLANPGSATLSGTTAVSAANGLASFSGLSLNKAAAGYTLQASSPGLTSVTSTPFNVTPGAPAAIAFSNLPASWTVGVPGTLTLSVVDAWGNTVPTYQGTVALASTDAQALLAGPVTFAAADSGQKLVANAATFVTPGTQRLTATDGAGLFGTSPDLNVLAAQAPAILHDANAVAAMGVPYLYNALGAVRAVGASPLSFSLCGAPSGFVLDSASGRILWTPSAAGTVSVCLQVSNAFGQDAYTFSVAVSGRAPTAVQASMSLQPPSGPAPLQVAFDGSASMGDASALPLTYRWDFADGHSVRPGVLTSNTYLVPGSYRAALSVLDVFGDSASTSAVVDVLGPQGLRPPHVLIVASATSATASLSTQLSATVTPGSSPIARYAWDLGNGTSSSTPANTVTYGPGRYHVRLTVVDTAGLASTDAVELSVLSPDGKAPPECSIYVDAPQGIVPFTSHWSAGLLSPSGAALTPSWRLSSGEALQGASFDKAYASPGVYSAHLDVVDANGLGCSDSRTLYALPASGLVPPRALTVLPPTAQCGVPYRAQGAAQGASPLAWAFGPNPPAHASVDAASGDVLWMPTRDDVGPHLFTLTASNPAGTDALSQTVTVSCPPVRALAVGCGCSTSSRTSPLAFWPLLALGFFAVRPRRRRPVYR